MFKTKLRDLESYGDWEHDLGSERKQALFNAYNLNQEVTVLGVEISPGSVDKRHGFYNIELQDGTQLPAISGFHLLDIADYKPTLACQYVVELHVANYLNSGLAHDLMAAAIEHAIASMLKGAGFGGHVTTVGSVTHETDFLLPGDS